MAEQSDPIIDALRTAARPLTGETTDYDPLRPADARAPRRGGPAGRLRHPRGDHRRFQCRLAAQFDALVHKDHTDAPTPLDAVSQREAAAPETYPFGE